MVWELGARSSWSLLRETERSRRSTLWRLELRTLSRSALWRTPDELALASTSAAARRLDSLMDIKCKAKHDPSTTRIIAHILDLLDRRDQPLWPELEDPSDGVKLGCRRIPRSAVHVNIGLPDSNTPRLPRHQNLLSSQSDRTRERRGSSSHQYGGRDKFAKR